eukprot:gnl/MRDRNA2_/MRDRNA2_66654_c0_seq2.p1 gnl/MRDRNA2_/MRDRNA2_66654_c0~~gnl/MRDRNA2_/MRDRNA2_66654_c0_seq2.p1  ORF type:complete len:605 (+),score=107.30 gnl/MRDRNA2_/MRDRNA2_66654_c0_seq2:56-1870(+)
MITECNGPWVHLSDDKPGPWPHAACSNFFQHGVVSTCMLLCISVTCLAFGWLNGDATLHGHHQLNVLAGAATELSIKSGSDDHVFDSATDTKDEAEEKTRDEPIDDDNSSPPRSSVRRDDDTNNGDPHSKSLDDDMYDLVNTKNEDGWLRILGKIINMHGKDAVEAWKDPDSKHHHRLIHQAVCRNYPRVIEALVERYGFNVNLPRDSDLCTPMHLAVWYKRSDSILALKELGADLSLKNTYGESCDDKYETLVAKKPNVVWLELETTGLYKKGNQSPQILEITVILTDPYFEELDRGRWVIGGYTQEELEDLSEFHQRYFRDEKDGGAFPPLEGSPGNGLFSDIINSKITPEIAEKEIISLVSKHCLVTRSRLGGNSIRFDREILKIRMPVLHSYLSGETFDLSPITGQSSVLRRHYYRELICEVYRKKNPDKLDMVDTILRKYAGKEAQIYMDICKKYDIKIQHQTEFLPGFRPWRKDYYKELLCEVYRAKNPAKLKEVDNLLKKYEGKEWDMYNALCKKYGWKKRKIYDAGSTSGVYDEDRRKRSRRTSSRRPARRYHEKEDTGRRANVRNESRSETPIRESKRELQRLRAESPNLSHSND